MILAENILGPESFLVMFMMRLVCVGMNVNFCCCVRVLTHIV